eukprot:scaffold88664_cov27-Tisochrysis_lutea.AAC.1
MRAGNTSRAAASMGSLSSLRGFGGVEAMGDATSRRAAHHSSSGGLNRGFLGRDSDGRGYARPPASGAGYAHPPASGTGHLTAVFEEVRTVPRDMHKEDCAGQDQLQALAC